MKSFIFILFSFAFIFVQCSGRKNQTAQNVKPVNNAQMIVYGSPDCSHCIHFIQELDSAGIIYDFKAVTEDTAMFREMMRKIQSAEIKGFIAYPVVDVKGNILVRPSISEVSKYLIANP